MGIMKRQMAGTAERERRETRGISPEPSIQWATTKKKRDAEALTRDSKQPSASLDNLLKQGNVGDRFERVIIASVPYLWLTTGERSRTEIVTKETARCGCRGSSDCGHSNHAMPWRRRRERDKVKWLRKCGEIHSQHTRGKPYPIT
jgi:hypothetical protein